MAFRQSGTVPDSPGWAVRAVPNKYPAVVRDNDTYGDLADFQTRFPSDVNGKLDGFFFIEHAAYKEALSEASSRNDRLYDMRFPGVGHHEVIIDSPRHVLSVTAMTENEVLDMFRMYRERLKELKAENRWACVEIFKNVGAAAGASIPHTHSQLIAMPFVPLAFQSTLLRAKQYQEQSPPQRSGPGCFWCDKLRFEILEQARIIEETDNFVALCPFVSRFSAEVEIFPKTHQSGFEQMEDNDLLAEFAALSRRTIARLEQAVFGVKDTLAYNYVLQTQPFAEPRGTGENLFHWHLSILPSLARAAGFEWGTGLHINPVSPENAAEQLRKITVS